MGTEFDHGQRAASSPPPPDQQPAAGPRIQLPRSVQRARDLMYVQGGLGVLSAIFGLLLIVVGAVVGHTQAVLPLVIGVITFAFTVVLAVLSFVLASMVKTRRPGVRTAILVFESIVAALQVLNMLAVVVLVVKGGSLRGVVQALIGLAIVLGILIPMAREEARAWFLSAT